MSLPDKKLSRVVFPEPEGPRIAVNVEALMSPYWRCRIVFVYFFTLALILAS